MNRRDFNKLLGSAMLASPLAVNAESSQRIKLKKNVVLINNDYGFQYKRFFPANDSLDSPYLKMYCKVRDKMTVFKGIEQTEMGGGHRSHHSIFTAQSKYGKNVKPFVSLDQFIASRVVQESRHKFLTLCTGKGSQTSWSLSGQAVPFLGNAGKAFERIFTENISTQDLLNEKDYLISFAKKVGSGADSPHYRRSLNELQKGIDEKIRWSKEPLPEVDYKFQPHKNEFMNIPIYLDFIKMALQKKQCRIFSFNMGTGGTVDIEGVSEGYHALTHSGKDPDKVKKLIKVEEYQLRCLSKFLNDLEDLKLLDETLVIITGAFGHSNTHSTKNLPCLLAGGGIKHGGLVQCKDKNDHQIHPLTHLYVSYMEMVGLSDVNTFAGYTGNMNKYFG